MKNIIKLYDRVSLNFSTHLKFKVLTKANNTNKKLQYPETDLKQNQVKIASKAFANNNPKNI